MKRNPGQILETCEAHLTGDELVTSDTHFFHKNIIRYTGRPHGSIWHMDDDLKAKWNETVGPDDTIIVVGDLAFGNAGAKEELLKELNGYKVLVKGNHDETRAKMMRAGFSEAYLELWGSVMVDGEPLTYLMRHVPCVDQKILDRFDLMICGHVHEKWVYSPPKTYNVGTDQWDFRPQRLKDILAHARERQAKLPVQLTATAAWTPRDNQLTDIMYEKRGLR
jgi:calcineurin-like phosphoesterase family protein